MKGSLLLCAAIICLAQGTDAAAELIRADEGDNITVVCLRGGETQLEPPPGCIVSGAECVPYRYAVKYLCRDSECQNPPYQTTTGGRTLWHIPGKYLLEYEKKNRVATLRLTIFNLTSKDAGLYRCGLRTPSDLHISKQFQISVTEKTFSTGFTTIFQPTAPFIPGISTEKQTEVDKIVHAEEGQNITVECPLEHLKIPKPPTKCFQDRRKCLYYFNPVVSIKKKLKGGSSTIISQKDYAEHERFSLKYGEEVLTVGITNLTKNDSGRYECGGQAASGNTVSLTFELIVDDAVAKGNRRLLLLLLIPALLLLMAGGLLVLICYKKRKSNCDPQRADTSRDKDVVLYENLPAPAPQPADSAYETLSPHTRDHDQVYISLHSPQPSQSVC